MLRLTRVFFDLSFVSEDAIFRYHRSAGLDNFDIVPVTEPIDYRTYQFGAPQIYKFVFIYTTFNFFIATFFYVFIKWHHLLKCLCSLLKRSILWEDTTKRIFLFFFSFICMDNHYSYVSLKVAKGCQFRDHPSLIRPSIARSARNPRIGPYTRPLGLTASAKLRVNLRKSWTLLSGCIIFCEILVNNDLFLT